MVERTDGIKFMDADPATCRHFEVWLAATFQHEDERDLARFAMVVEFNRDPLLWMDRGWPALADASDAWRASTGGTQ